MNPGTVRLSQHAINMINAREKIKGIKAIRADTTYGLKEAKDLYEEIEAGKITAYADPGLSGMPPRITNTALAASQITASQMVTSVSTYPQRQKMSWYIEFSKDVESQRVAAYDIAVNQNGDLLLYGEKGELDAAFAAGTWNSFVRAEG